MLTNNKHAHISDNRIMYSCTVHYSMHVFVIVIIVSFYDQNILKINSSKCQQCQLSYLMIHFILIFLTTLSAVLL